MMDFDNLKEWDDDGLMQVMAFVEEKAQELMQKDGEVYPIAFFCTSKIGEKTRRAKPELLSAAKTHEPKRVVLAMPMDMGDKERAALLVQGVAKDNEVYGIVMVNEAWYLDEVADTTSVDIPPSEHPDRKEAVVVTLESARINRTTIFNIIREDGKQPRLEKAKELSTEDGSATRMSSRFTKGLWHTNA